MLKLICDDVLEGTTRRRIVFFDEDTGDAIMTDGPVYESEDEANSREAYEFLILEGSDDDEDDDV